MGETIAYDKAKWHDETVEKYGLPDSHASHHIVFFFRWLIERELISDWLQAETPEDLQAVRDGRLSALDYFCSLDRCLVSDMLTDQGNAFAAVYFDYTRGRYIDDLVGALKGSLPSEYHIPFNDETYSRLKQVIDSRFAAWKSGDLSAIAKPPKPKKGWRFWK